MRLSLQEISQILDLPETEDTTVCTRAVTDSRECKKGDLFVCIKGENVDGHDFALDAINNGASAIIGERPVASKNIPVFMVKNSIHALGKLAKAWRDKYKGIVIGLTGTAGKTTLKDALAGTLSNFGKTAKTEKNHNNQLGAALTILATDGDEKFWVIEAGISHERDMDELGEMIIPNLAIILNAGTGHVEGLGKMGVAWHKARLLKWLRSDGFALINSSYPELVKEATEYSRPFFCFNPEANSNAAYRMIKEIRAGTYELLLDNDIITVTTPYSGKWGGEISLASLAAIKLLNLSATIASKSLADAQMPKGRMNIIKKKNFTIYNDTYNANPLSMSQMLATVSQNAEQKNQRWFAVLGEMGELGEVSEEAHRELGRQLAKLKPEFVIWKGNFIDKIIAGSQDIQLIKPICIYPINSDEEFKYKITELAENGLMQANSDVLFKGSRFNKLEKWLTIFEEFLERKNISKQQDI